MVAINITNRVIEVTLVALLLAGCAAPASTPASVLQPATPTAIPPTVAPTPIPPTVTPTAIPPTSTSTPDYIKATSLADILGTWYNPNKKLYLRFYEDGFLHHSHSLDEIDTAPYAKHEIWFDGTQISLKQLEVSGVPSCGDAIGIYEIRLYSKGNIQIVKIKDSCPQRAGETALPFMPVR